MNSKILQFIIHPFIKKPDTRTNLVTKNILYSLLLKVSSIIISFMLVPITIDYLNPLRYGIWLTLSSILSWINYFDLGIGNGLKNKLTEALAQNNINLATIYVSTSYALISIITIIFVSTFYIISPLFHWDIILGAPLDYRDELQKVILIVTLFFGLNFIFKLINTILHSFQKIALSETFNVIANLISLITIFILVKTQKEESFTLICIIFSGTPVIVLLVASIILFLRKLHNIRPQLKYINLKYSKDLLSLGIQFFFIQLSCLIVFSSSNVLISYLFSPIDVTTYNIAYKYFSFITMFFQILITPLWPAYTDAYTKKDIRWIKNSTKKLIYLWGIISACTIIMLIFSKYFYYIWIGKDINIPWAISISCAIYVILFTWYNIFIYLINATGKIRLQTYYTFISIILAIPTAIWLSKYWGVTGIILSNIISILPATILGPLQYYYLVIKKSKIQIWYK